MKQITSDVHMLPGFKAGINAYLLDDVLVDARTKWASKSIRRSLSQHNISAHALTHAHSDHQGASASICRTLEIPYCVPEGDVSVAERGNITDEMPSTVIGPVLAWLWSGPGHAVDTVLEAGDIIGGFEVIQTPGHSEGHVSYWRESDGMLVVGDVLNNINFLTLNVRLGEPPETFTPDPVKNRESARKLADLEPETILFGHGPPLYDGEVFVDFVAGLPHSR